MCVPVHGELRQGADAASHRVQRGRPGVQPDRGAVHPEGQSEPRHDARPPAGGDRQSTAAQKQFHTVTVAPIMLENKQVQLCWSQRRSRTELMRVLESLDNA